MMIETYECLPTVTTAVEPLPPGQGSPTPAAVTSPILEPSPTEDVETDTVTSLDYVTIVVATETTTLFEPIPILTPTAAPSSPSAVVNTPVHTASSFLSLFNESFSFSRFVTAGATTGTASASASPPTLVLNTLSSRSAAGTAPAQPASTLTFSFGLDASPSMTSSSQVSDLPTAPKFARRQLKSSKAGNVTAQQALNQLFAAFYVSWRLNSGENLTAACQEASQPSVYNNYRSYFNDDDVPAYINSTLCLAAVDVLDAGNRTAAEQLGALQLATFSLQVALTIPGHFDPLGLCDSIDWTLLSHLGLASEITHSLLCRQGEMQKSVSASNSATKEVSGRGTSMSALTSTRDAYRHGTFYGLSKRSKRSRKPDRA